MEMIPMLQKIAALTTIGLILLGSDWLKSYLWTRIR